MTTLEPSIENDRSLMSHASWSGARQRFDSRPESRSYRRTSSGSDVLQRDKVCQTPALFRPLAMIFVCQKVLERSQKKGPETAAFRANFREVVSLQQAGEEFLGQILAFSGIVALPPREDVHRIPISRAELFEGFVCFLPVVLSGCQHNTPVGRTKCRGTTRSGLAIERGKRHAAGKVV